jgi:hypothetical protein
MTASRFHVSNLTPGSECNLTSRFCCAISNTRGSSEAAAPTPPPLDLDPPPTPPPRLLLSFLAFCDFARFLLAAAIAATDGVEYEVACEVSSEGSPSVVSRSSSEAASISASTAAASANAAARRLFLSSLSRRSCATRSFMRSRSAAA